jgi:hypothetical protein
MYWVSDRKGGLEVLDGQQRTISICEYVNNNFSIGFQSFVHLTSEEQQQILDYRIQVYVCSGTDKEKLEWFETINIAGEKLTAQELRNAVYTGEWLTDAKKKFSKTGCGAYELGKDYMSGSPIRQDYLETVLEWVSDNHIEEYMSSHQFDTDANALWLYYQSVINWVKALFPIYRKEMKGINWGGLYNESQGKLLNPKATEGEVSRLMMDKDVTNKKGIYAYILDGNPKYLSIRSFDNDIKREAYESQKGICVKCNKHFPIEEMEADHITPWSEGGKTIASNCQMLCKLDNRIKSNK